MDNTWQGTGIYLIHNRVVLLFTSVTLVTCSIGRITIVTVFITSVTLVTHDEKALLVFIESEKSEGEIIGADKLNSIASVCLESLY
jgi:hypothetical protein